MNNTIEVKFIQLNQNTYLGVWERENGLLVTSVSSGRDEITAQERIIKNFKHKGWTAANRIGGPLPANATFKFIPCKLTCEFDNLTNNNN